MNAEMDPSKLTAYALGELGEAESAEIETRLAEDADARVMVEEARAAAGLLSSAFPRSRPLSLGAERRTAILSRAALQFGGGHRTSVYHVITHRGSDARRWAGSFFAVAASLGVIFIGVIFYFMRNATDSSKAVSRGTDGGAVTMPGITILPHPPGSHDALAVRLPGESEAPVGPSASLIEHPFVETQSATSSALPLHVESTSYVDLRRAIEEGRLPARQAVRIEEMLAAFTYDDPAPQEDALLAGRVEIGGCPWAADHRLARVAIRGRELRAGDAQSSLALKGEVTFNPLVVRAFRLIGFEQSPGSRLGAEDGTLSSPPSVVALFEIIPRAAVEPAGAAKRSMLSVRVDRRTPEIGLVRILELSGIDEGRTLEQAGNDFRFSAAVAGFGLLLQDSAFKGSLTFDQVIELADKSAGQTPQRRQLASLARKARELRGRGV
jgi:hypothetical protein